jgi:transposase
MPICTAYPGPLSVLVMDNAKIHHGDAILELADRFGIAFNIFCSMYLIASLYRSKDRVSPTLFA